MKLALISLALHRTAALPDWTMLDGSLVAVVALLVLSAAYFVVGVRLFQRTHHRAH